MRTLIFILVSLFILPAQARDLPVRYTELLDYVQEAPDQGKSNMCLYVASTGAMEILLNKRAGIKHPVAYGPNDLSEPALVYTPSQGGSTLWEEAVLRFNTRKAVHIDDWPYEPWSGSDIDDDVWNSRNWTRMPKIEVPEVDTIRLFVKGSRWSTHVLTKEHVQMIKEALVTHRSPVMINYNDNQYWHVILVVGYDDELPGECYQITKKECAERPGSFYVRDSFGVPVEVRDQDWLRINANAAFVIKEKQ